MKNKYTHMEETTCDCNQRWNAQGRQQSHTPMLPKPTLTTFQWLDAVFSGKYDEEKIDEIRKWQKQTLI